MAQDTTRKTATQTQTENLDQQISNRAYDLYEARGREEGRDLDDWLRAEKEIPQQKTRTIAA
jgi:DUF2934 family protein